MLPLLIKECTVGIFLYIHMINDDILICLAAIHGELG